MIKKKTKSSFMIKHFDDYHEIRSKTHKYIELGCFPSKDEAYGYNRYFGLFFKGKQPSIKRVVSSILKKVQCDTETFHSTHYRTGLRIGISKEELIQEVKDSMSLGANGPDAKNDY